MSKIKLVNFNLMGNVLDKGCKLNKFALSELFTISDSRGLQDSRDSKLKNTNINKLIDTNKLQLFGEYFKLNTEDSIKWYLMYSRIYNCRFLEYAEPVTNFNKVWNYLKSQNIHISYTQYETEIEYMNNNEGQNKFANYCISDYTNEAIHTHMRKLNIHDYKQVINVDVNKYNLINSNTGVINVAVANSTSYVGLDNIQSIIMNRNTPDQYNKLVNDSRNILKTANPDYLITDISEVIQVVDTYKNS